jgi:uncharacterized protein (TIGR02145 family)
MKVTTFLSLAGMSGFLVIITAGCAKQGILAPTLEITSVTGITQTTAVCKVMLDKSGNSGVHQIVVNLSAPATYPTFDTNGILTPGEYTFKMSGLYPGTRYDMTASAANNNHWSGTSNTVTVTTQPHAGETVTDADGNVYHIISIGTQTWLFENLRTTHYQNGDPVEMAQGEEEVTSGLYAWYENNPQTYKPHYGALYNWYAVHDPRGICPAGWRVPTSSEFSKLISFLGGAASAGGKLKEAGNAHWGLDLNLTAGNDESGFTALPGGMGKLPFGTTWDEIGTNGYWWSATDNTAADASCLFLGNTTNEATRTNMPKYLGESVRCIIK